MKRNGYTLIEILVVLSVMAIVGLFSITAFNNYNQAQALKISTDEVITMLNSAKSRAQSQVKPDTICTATTLNGYGIEILADGRTYQLRIKCNGAYRDVIETKTLQNNVSFDASFIGKTILFPILTGGAQICDATGNNCKDCASKPGTDCPVGLIGNSGQNRYVAINSLGAFSLQATAPTLIPTITPTPQPKLVFVTSAAYGGGNLGGLTGADAKCQSLADAAGKGNTLGKTYKAWLSDSSNSPSTSTRFIKNIGPYVLVDGTRIADNWTDLTDGTLQHNINIAENGTLISNNTVWTNTKSNGDAVNASLSGSCNDWTYLGGTMFTVAYGQTGFNNGNWTNVGNSSFYCSGLYTSNSIYCFEQ